MLKQFLATAALASVLVTGAHAQQAEPAPAADEPSALTPPGETVESTDQNTAVEEPAGDAAMTEGGAADEGMAEEAAPGLPAGEGMAEEATTEEPTDATVDVDPAMPTTGGAAGEGVETGAWELEQGWSRVDLSAISTEELIGTDITDLEGETVATVDDVLVTTDGEVQNVAARFGGLLGLGTNLVLLEMSEIDVVMDADGAMTVRTNLSPEELEARPEFERDG